MTDKEINGVLKFEKHSPIHSVSKSDAKTFLKGLKTREEQEQCTEEKTITLKPLERRDIRDLAIELAETETFEGSIMGRPQSEKLEIIRENKGLISEYIEENKYVNRLFLDKSSDITENKWSPSAVWEFLVENPEYMKDL